MSRVAAIFRVAVILGWIGSVLGQVVVVAPNCTLSTYNWTTNSLGQNVCQMAGIALTPCSASNGITQVSIPVLNVSSTYTGPSAANNDTTDLCKCNSVFYSLISACGGCQGGSWVPYPTWTAACARVAEDGIWPSEQVGFPAHAAFPAWAFLPIASSPPLWNNLTAFSYSITNSTEVTSLPGPTNTASPISSSASASQTVAAPSQTSGTPSSGSSNAGAIAGGVVGGVVGVALLIVLGWYFYSRRKRRGVAPSAAFLGHEPGSAVSDAPAFVGQGSLVSTTPFKPYDPTDPSTFPDAMIADGQTGQSTVGFSSSGSPGPTINTTHQPGHKAMSSWGSQDVSGEYHGLPEV
ncbi:hypothetical protein K488DRAFT_86078 [Vararia minispora EC-137]|uniref:Uncharacterized protein n=1 Tax=Vararia minispora EC-137 TaxID=1314806 RepID=A0ACB8QKN0_9AGAM|nr:hypothetical protein K488DRAFT_86078 [Vararia minispora EC-137]